MGTSATLHAQKATGFLFPARQTIKRRRPRCHGLFELFNRTTGRQVELQEDVSGTALRLWLEQQGMPSQQVLVVNDGASGRALFAAAPISKGSKAVQVPQQLVLTAEAASSQLALGSLLEVHSLPAWSVLALWLAEARAAGASHSWARYMEVLPAQTGCVLEWADAEVNLLRGSHLHQVAEEIRSAARTSWVEMRPLLLDAEQQGLAEPGVYTEEAVAWAFCMLLTRLIRLPGLGDAEALVPWADFLNHDCQAGTHLDWDPASSAVVLQADRQYRPGQQVFVSYGQKTSGQLLLSYGFLPAPGTNPYDGCLLPMWLDSADPGLQWKEEVLAQQGLAPLQVFPLRMTALPVGLLQYAALASARITSRDQAQHVAAQLFSSIGGGGPDTGGLLTGGSADMHHAALQAVVQQCQRALKGYPASLEANKAELVEVQRQREGGSSRGQAASRREQVLQVVVGEQQVLSRTVFLLQQQQRQLRRG